MENFPIQNFSGDMVTLTCLICQEVGKVALET